MILSHRKEESRAEFAVRFAVRFTMTRGEEWSLNIWEKPEMYITKHIEWTLVWL